MFWFKRKNRKSIEDLLKENALILDVRNPDEFKAGHTKGAKNIPLSSLKNNTDKLDSSRPVITCCASGVRSGVAKRILKAQGFDVINGGAWQAVQSKLP